MNEVMEQLVGQLQAAGIPSSWDHRQYKFKVMGFDMSVWWNYRTTMLSIDGQRFRRARRTSAFNYADVIAYVIGRIGELSVRKEKQTEKERLEVALQHVMHGVRENGRKDVIANVGMDGKIYLTFTLTDITRAACMTDFFQELG